MYTINSKILQTPVTDGNILLLEPEAGLYFELNETSVLIYQAIAEELETNDILDRMTEKYNISQSVALEDIASLTKQLLENNIIKVKESIGACPKIAKES
ncbi:MAG: PqqD family protein [Alcanivoracaceae bacterium]|nr:PqqD family protein [Alcanivoracaceae bacterium]